MHIVTFILKMPREPQEQQKGVAPKHSRSELGRTQGVSCPMLPLPKRETEVQSQEVACLKSYIKDRFESQEAWILGGPDWLCNLKQRLHGTSVFPIPKARSHVWRGGLGLMIFPFELTVCGSFVLM